MRDLVSARTTRLSGIREVWGFWELHHGDQGSAESGVSGVPIVISRGSFPTGCCTMSLGGTQCTELCARRPGKCQVDGLGFAFGFLESLPLSCRTGTRICGSLQCCFGGEAVRGQLKQTSKLIDELQTEGCQSPPTMAVLAGFQDKERWRFPAGSCCSRAHMPDTPLMDADIDTMVGRLAA